jgi:hypothetical protein
MKLSVQLMYANKKYKPIIIASITFDKILSFNIIFP